MAKVTRKKHTEIDAELALRRVFPKDQWYIYFNEADYERDKDSRPHTTCVLLLKFNYEIRTSEHVYHWYTDYCVGKEILIRDDLELNWGTTSAFLDFVFVTNPYYYNERFGTNVFIVQTLDITS